MNTGNERESGGEGLVCVCVCVYVRVGGCDLVRQWCSNGQIRKVGFEQKGVRQMAEMNQ